ncbi:MAG: tetratricopeptide repeat protein [Deltaproteobacteria bacterium]|nr:tetratricopeptide repeat protein [Deltaproteobacteria bacterium]
MTRSLLVPLLALSLLPLPGCVTIPRFRDLEARVTVLEKEKEALQAEQQRNIARMERMHQDMQEATEALRKGGANLGADVDAIKADVSRLKGADEEVAYKVGHLGEEIDRIKKAMDEKLGIALVQLPKGLPEDADSLFKAGREAAGKGDNLTARGVLRKFLDTFPDEPRAGEAQFVVGETYFKEGKYGQAIREYQRVHDRYREQKGAPVPKSLLRLAEALLKQNDCKKAQGVLKYLTEYDRKAPEATRARDMLNDLKRKCK